MGSVGMRIASSNSRSSSLSSGVTGVWCAASAAANLDRQLAIFATATHRLMLHSVLSVTRSANRSGSVSARSIISASVMITLSWDCVHTGPALFRPCGPDLSTAQNDSRDLYAVPRTAADPPVIPVLHEQGRVRPPAYVKDVTHDLLVVPACRELSFAWFTDSVPVTAATAWLAVEYVGGPLGGDANVLRFRPVLGVNRIPTRTFRVSRPTAAISRPTVRGDPERLVVLLAATRLGRLWPPRGHIATRHLPLGPIKVVVRLV